ncbi:MAG: uracil-DNA glycosylase family protein [Burkholderiaceae bacterium]|nr:uracil-DNA glycosylase family protein [Burkholderiaceae bacterium]
MNESQRRAFRALGIGPLWRRRAPPAQSQVSLSDSAAAFASRPSSASSASSAALRLFALADEGGDWLFVGEAAPVAPDAGDLLAPDAARLLGRMLFALGLRTARRAVVFDESAELPSPLVVVALGAGAAHALLGTDAPLASLRGRVHEWRFAQQPVPLVVSAHPSQLLEAAQEKAAAWADLCLARAAVGQTISACSGRSAPPSRTPAGSPDGGG